MKHKLKAVLLSVALLGLGAHTPLSAASVHKAEQQTAKKGHVKAAKKAPAHTKSANKHSHAKTAAAKSHRKVAGKRGFGCALRNHLALLFLFGVGMLVH